MGAKKRPRGERERSDFLDALTTIDPRATQSTTTVLIAFASNLVVAIAKSAAAVVTGSASLVAEAAHSWADTGNEVFLVVADRRSRRPPDRMHPLGHGREAPVPGEPASTHSMRKRIVRRPCLPSNVAKAVARRQACVESAARRARRASGSSACESACRLFNPLASCMPSLCAPLD
jgi:hypothetical protein